MSFAEVVLRLGVAMVSWLVIYMHFVMIFAVQAAQCPGGDTSPWKVSLVTAGLVVGASFLIRVGRTVPGIGGSLRALAVPLVFLVPWAVWTVAPFAAPMTLDATGPCTVLFPDRFAAEARTWTTWWAPAQAAALLLLAASAVRLYRQ